MRCGILGLPNAGKSTLFQALTMQKVAAENYPFCTIEPNVGVVQVPDNRIDKLSAIFKPEKVIYPVMEFVDIAGLVKGAHKGEGLGHRFLSHVRESKALIHVVRCFEDKNIGHVYQDVNPLRDIEIVESELLLADLATTQNRIDKIKKPSAENKEMKKELSLLEKLLDFLNQGRPATQFQTDIHEELFIQRLHLLTRKSVLYVCNADENHSENPYVQQVREKMGENRVLSLSGKLESELAELDESDRLQYLENLQMEEPALNRLIRSTYALLDLITFFTASSKEVRGWTVKKGSTAPQAGGVIHSDFEKGFIRAETYSVEDLFRLGSLSALKSKGFYRLEGKNYCVQDGDVLHFRFNV